MNGVTCAAAAGGHLERADAMSQVHRAYYFWVAYCYLIGCALIVCALGFAAVAAFQGAWVQTGLGVYFAILFAWFFRSVVFRIVIRRVRSNMMIRLRRQTRTVDQDS
jgi:hypothetical protein